MIDLPSFLENPDFENIRDEILDRYQILVSEAGKEYKPELSDDQKLIADACAYQITIEKARINDKIRLLLTQYSEGKALDEVAESFFGERRNSGAKPTALVKLILSAARQETLTVSQGLVFTGDAGEKAVLTRDVVFAAGETEKEGVLELQEEVKESDAKPSTPINPLPYLQGIEYLTGFSGGGNPESDEDFAERLKINDVSKNPAGSISAYEYHAKKADSRIQAIKVDSPAPCEVAVYVYSTQQDDTMRTRVFDALNAEEVRPLSDKLTVELAEVVEYQIKVKIIPSAGADKNELILRGSENLNAIKKHHEFGAKITEFRILDALNLPEATDAVVESGTIDCGPGQFPELKNIEVYV